MAQRNQRGLIAALLLALTAAATALSTLEQIEVKSFEHMREVERHQLKLAEKYYTKGEFKIALAEYEKFVTLYETSPGAPYAQLMWSHSMMHLKKPATAMRDGFLQSDSEWVANFDIDYFSGEFLAKALALSETADIVLASKRVEGADDQRTATRRFATWTFNQILRVDLIGLLVVDQSFRSDLGAVAANVHVTTHFNPVFTEGFRLVCGDFGHPGRGSS